MALHTVVVPDPVIPAGGIEHPVAYVHQIQQTAELFLCQMQFHNRPPSGALKISKHSIAEYHGKFHRKYRAKSPNFYLLSLLIHSTIVKLPQIHGIIAFFLNQGA